MRTLVACALVAALAGCGKDEAKTEGTGLPPADQVAPPQAMPGQVQGRDPHAGMDMQNPHAGMDMQNPHAGMNTQNPHAGMDMNNPHAGMDMGAPAAEPTPVDPSKFLKGKIVATAETKDKIKPGAILFLAVKPINPITGSVIGGTMAVERIDVDALPVDFHLSGANAMMPGTSFDGDVVITARIDQDGEARSKQPGDVEGEVKAKIPAENLELQLDTLVN